MSLGAWLPAQNAAQLKPVVNESRGGFTQWRDPAENAFSLQLPAGWNITGGTLRRTRIEPHYLVRAQSPDGSVELFKDNPDLLIHQVPDQRSAALRIREGSRFPSAMGRNDDAGPVSNRSPCGWTIREAALLSICHGPFGRAGR